ncbi:MAG TPA: M13 family metallopeptidase N-terminal domain-containing protein, partial [Woeseiaceae bacterium]
MKKAVLLQALCLTLAACGPNERDPVAELPPPDALHSGVLTDYMNRDVRPGEDFFAYVNGGWVDSAEIPADKAGYGIATILHEGSQDRVKGIIEQSAAGDFKDGSDEQKVGDLYLSYMDMETRNKLGITPLAREFERIDSIANHDDLAVYFAAANKAGYNMPFALAQYVDFKDPDTYMMYTWQGGLGLPDREYYFKEDDRSQDIRSSYQAHVEKMLDLA